MEDNKTKTSGGPNNQEKTGPATVKIESKEDLIKQAKEQKVVFGSTGSDDINKNLGHFTNKVKQQDTSATVELKLDADAKVVEKAANEKIDFEKFTRTKKYEGKPKTKFGEKVGLMLRSRKGLTITWIWEMVVMALAMAGAIVLVIIMTKALNRDWIIWSSLENTKTCAKVGLVFEWIAIFPCLIPLIYLLTTWFIGINQVASSKIYHYMFWGCLGLSVICFIVGLGCLIKPLNDMNNFPYTMVNSLRALI